MEKKISHLGSYNLCDNQIVKKIINNFKLTKITLMTQIPKWYTNSKLANQNANLEETFFDTANDKKLNLWHR